MKKTIMFLLMVVGSASMFGQSGTSPACDSPRQDQGALVGAFRVLNTAEMRFFKANQRFATLPELVNFEETKKMAADKRYAQPVAPSVTIGSADDPLPGYSVRVIVGNDGKSYAITATKRDGACRGVGATTDDRGLIYLIEPLRWGGKSP